MDYIFEGIYEFLVLKDTETWDDILWPQRL